MLGGAAGVAPANVVVLGAGMAGSNAARIAAGMEAQVTIVDKEHRADIHLRADERDVAVRDGHRGPRRTEAAVAGTPRWPSE